MLALAGELGHRGERLGIRHCPPPVSMGEAGLNPREDLSEGTHLEGKLHQELSPSSTLSQQSMLMFKAESLQG